MKLVAIPAVVIVLGAAAWAFAGDAPEPVVVTSTGPKAMRARVAVGTVLPCSSPSNTILFDGPLAPGQVATLQTDASCVCVEHTFDDFPDKNWSAPETVCRPTVCTGAGRSHACRPAADPTIRVSLSSSG